MKLTKSLLTSIALSALVACGGGGGGGAGTVDNTNNTTPNQAAVLVGQLVDAPTAGINYQCGTQRGKTDSEGKFNYQSGQSCTFSVGNVTIGALDSVPSDKVVTPYDLVNVSRLSKIDPQAIGIAQLLQSLDDGSVPNKVTINSTVEARLASTSVKNLATDRDSVRSSALSQLVSDGGSNTLIDRATASQNMEAYLDSINLDRTVRAKNKNAPMPSASSQFQYIYKYGWQTTDQYALRIWCDMNGNPPNCTPTYFVDGCRSYNGACTRTNGYEQIADSNNGVSYRAYPIKPTRSFNAKYIGVGIGGGLPDFVKIYDSHNGSWNPQYTPSSGEVPNNLLTTTTKFDIFFTGTRSDADGNQHTRHPGTNNTTPGFQAYLGSSGVDIQANQIYWIVVKYSDTGVRNERCVDFIGPNSFAIPDTFASDTLLHWGTSLGNGFAFELMSADGVNWEPSNMIQGGTCNTFLAN